jgi:hypothetical protein
VLASETLLPWLMLVLAIAVIVGITGSVSSVNIIRIGYIILSSMLLPRVIIVILLTVGASAEVKMRSAPIIVLVVLVFIWKSGG